MSLAPSRSAVRRQWRGSGIALTQVVQQINKLQVEIARLEAAEGDHIQSRSKVMDLVVVAGDADEAERAARIVGDLADRHPSRAIIVLDEPSKGESRIDAAITVAASSQLSCDMCQYEEVFLRVRGPVAEHIPSLVDSLVVSDVPAFLWWTGSPPVKSRRFRDALLVADAAIVDSARFADPAATFHDLVELRRERRPHIVFTDFAWGRVAAWRELIAQFFNPPDRVPFLGGVRRVEIDHVGANRVGAALVGGWLASTLGWRFDEVRADRDGLVASYRHGDARVEVVLRPAGGRGLGAGDIAAVTVDTRLGDRSCRLVAAAELPGAERVRSRGDLDGHAIPARVVPMPRLDHATLLSQLLVICRTDEPFLAASNAAAEVLRRIPPAK